MFGRNVFAQPKPHDDPISRFVWTEPMSASDVLVSIKLCLNQTLSTTRVRQCFRRSARSRWDEQKCIQYKLGGWGTAHCSCENYIRTFYLKHRLYLAGGKDPSCPRSPQSENVARWDLNYSYTIYSYSNYFHIIFFVICFSSETSTFPIGPNLSSNSNEITVFRQHITWKGLRMGPIVFEIQLYLAPSH